MSGNVIADVTAHIPPKHKQYIRRYGLYSSRSRGKWEEKEHLCRLAPDGWKEKHEVQTESQEVVIEEEKSQPGTKKQRSTLAKLIKIHLLIITIGSNEVAVIMDPTEIEKILCTTTQYNWQTTKSLQHLVKIGRAPPNIDSASLN